MARRLTGEIESLRRRVDRLSPEIVILPAQTRTKRRWGLMLGTAAAACAAGALIFRAVLQQREESGMAAESRTPTTH
jgi:hypothetical protein